METLIASPVADGFAYGEGPRWHAGRLWFSDTANGAVLTMDEAGRIEVAVETQHPSGLGWLPDGTLAISTLYAAKIKHAGPEGIRVRHDLSDRAWSTNDMLVAVAPALGGVDRRTLYMIINETTHGGIARGESMGRIEQVRVDVPGSGSP